jgi:hypothetical protein
MAWCFGVATAVPGLVFSFRLNVYMSCLSTLAAAHLDLIQSKGSGHQFDRPAHL